MWHISSKNSGFNISVNNSAWTCWIIMINIRGTANTLPKTIRVKSVVGIYVSCKIEAGDWQTMAHTNMTLPDKWSSWDSTLNREIATRSIIHSHLPFRHIQRNYCVDVKQAGNLSKNFLPISWNTRWTWMDAWAGCSTIINFVILKGMSIYKIYDYDKKKGKENFLIKLMCDAGKSVLK